MRQFDPPTLCKTWQNIMIATRNCSWALLAVCGGLGLCDGCKKLSTRSVLLRHHT